MSKAKKPGAKKPASKKSVDGPFADVLAELRGVDDDGGRWDVLFQAANARSMSITELVWQMIRAGVLDLWTERAVWNDLADAADRPLIEDVIAVLRAAPASREDASRRSRSEIISWWPEAIDRLVVTAYPDDLGAFDAAAPTLPTVAGDGLRTVQRRAGAIERAAAPADIVAELARAVAKGRGRALWYAADGEPRRVGIRDPRFLDIVRAFATPEEWGRALLAAALDEPRHPCDVQLFAETLRMATSDELALLLERFNPTDQEVLLVRFLLEVRSESAEWFHRQVRVQLGGAKEVCALVAILRCKQRGEPVPPGWENDLVFDTIVCTPESDLTGYELHVESLRYLGEQRAAARLTTANAQFVDWKSIAVLHVAPLRSVLDAVAGRIAASPPSEPLDGTQWAAARAMGRLGDVVVPVATAARNTTTAGARVFFDLVIETALRPEATPRPRESNVATLESVAEVLAGLSLSGVATRRIFLLERDEAAATTAMTSHIGGAPVGISADAWPRRGKRADPRMEHLLTLAAADLPGGALPGGIAAIALFISDRRNNLASTPDTDETAVVTLGAADLAAGGTAGGPPPRELARCALRITPIDVPVEVFSGEPSGPDVEALRDALLRSPGYALGGPIWLQDDAFAGEFVCQLDASLVPMNLGDQGVLYVFSDRAFWQSA
jgi:hypothetical protein